MTLTQYEETFGTVDIFGLIELAIEAGMNPEYAVSHADHNNEIGLRDFIESNWTYSEEK